MTELGHGVGVRAHYPIDDFQYFRQRKKFIKSFIPIFKNSSVIQSAGIMVTVAQNMDGMDKSKYYFNYL